MHILKVYRETIAEDILLSAQKEDKDHRHRALMKFNMCALSIITSTCKHVHIYLVIKSSAL